MVSSTAPPSADTIPELMQPPIIINSRKRPHKTIGFVTSPPHSVRSLPAISKEERSATWYCAEDYELFEKVVKKTVSCIRRGTAKKNKGLTARGLEKYFSSQYHEEKKKRERKHYRSILREQRRQRSQGEEPNPKLLRMISVVNSKWALEKALDLAKHDANEVGYNAKTVEEKRSTITATTTTATTTTTAKQATEASDSETSGGKISLDVRSTSSV